MSESKQQFEELKTEYKESEYDLEQLEVVKAHQVKLYVGNLQREADNGDSDGAGGSKEEDPTWQDIPMDMNPTIDFFNQLDILNKAAFILISEKNLTAEISFKNTENPKDQMSSDSSTLAEDEKVSEEQKKESGNENQPIKMEDFREPPVVHKWCIVKWIYVVFAGAMLLIAFIVLLHFFCKGKNVTKP